MSGGGGQRRLSDLLSAVPRSSVGSSVDSTLAADEELLVGHRLDFIWELLMLLASYAAGWAAGVTCGLSHGRSWQQAVRGSRLCMPACCA